MKKIAIKYNPYLLKTDITVDGMRPKPNSSLNIGNQRLQEWVEDLPNIILSEYRDKNVTIDFTGTQADYEDLKSVFEINKAIVSATCNLHKTNSTKEVEETIDKIFKDIQEGPISELKTKSITDAFQKAKNSMFEVNVIATMSSGKSSLINALLGTQLMPAANEATTATIVKIIDTDQDNFSVIAKDKSHNVVKKINDAKLEDMIKLNNDPRVTEVELKGKIPFVISTGMKLVLVDTPGPNNSRDKHHEEMTYQMIADSDKSLVLFVMNGQQLGINDEKILLDYICQNMKEGGKQGRERFIFAINKMDSFKPNPKNDGPECIVNALNNVRKGLEERGIFNPNIFPVSALAALEKRTEDDEPMALDNFRRGTNKYEALHFENYYEYSHLPLSVRHKIEEYLQEADDDDVLEIHTGIVSIEQAISQYINKYARATKVKDLVDSFNNRLKELSTIAHLEEAIRKDKDVKKQLEAQIEKIKSNIESAQNAAKLSKSIDGIDVTTNVEEGVKKYINEVNTSISKMLSRYTNKVEKKKAKKQCEDLEKECNAITKQIKVQIESILGKAYKDVIGKIVNEYKKYLAELNLGVENSALAFNPINLVSSSLADISSIVDNNTEEVDEGGYQTRTRQKFVASQRKIWNPFSWFKKGDHYETEYYEEWVSKYVDYVDMNEVSSEYLTEFRKSLTGTQKSAIEYVISETKRLKEHLKGEIVKINKLLTDKLNELSKTEADTKAKAEDIAIKENNLAWLESIQKRVNEIIEF